MSPEIRLPTSAEKSVAMPQATVKGAPGTTIALCGFKREEDAGMDPAGTVQQLPRDAVNDDASVREAVAVFKTARDLEEAIDELLRSGFHRSALSLLANESEVVAKLGHVYRKTSDLAADPSVPRTAYVSTEAVGDGQGAVISALMYVAAGVLMGPVAAARGSLPAIAGAAALGGVAAGLVGTWLARLIGDHHARRIQEHLDRGGLLLWARTWNSEQERRAVDILERHSGEDVHIQHCHDGACVPTDALDGKQTAQEQSTIKRNSAS